MNTILLIVIVYLAWELKRSNRLRREINDELMVLGINRCIHVVSRARHRYDDPIIEYLIERLEALKDE